MAKKKATRKKPSLEVTQFAKALEEWAAEGPDREQRQRLLKWLLSRCGSHRFEGSKGKYVIERTDIEDVKIKEAVKRAMAGYNPDLPTTGWVRGGPIWPKGYGDFWPKGYA